MYGQRNNLTLKDAEVFFSGIGIDFIEITVPIQSNVFCVRRKDRKWAAYEIGNKIPIIEFGKYSYMWGYDNGYCLVDTFDTNEFKFINRAIIDEQGEEVIKPYTFQNIWNFYSSKEPYILVQISNEIVELDRSVLKLL